MSNEEKNSLAFGVIAIVAYLCYLVLIFTNQRGPLVETEYVAPMLSTIGVAIVASILVNVVIRVLSLDGRDTRDQRDRQIYRFGESIGQGFIVIGAAAALVLAMLEIDYFWIANVVYLAFVLSAIVSTAAKLVAYRRGFQPW